MGGRMAPAFSMASGSQARTCAPSATSRLITSMAGAKRTSSVLGLQASPSTPTCLSLTTHSARGTPTRRHALGRLPTPPPLPENLLSDCTENCPLRPLRAPRRFRNPKIGQQLGAQPTPRFRVMIDALLDALLDSRSTMLPFTSTPSPPAPLAIRKAPSASVESIEPRPPRPCEVGRPKGRRRKSRRQSHNFFKHRRSGSETAAILLPGRKVLAPARAGCSLADPVEVEEIKKWRTRNPAGKVVSYIKTKP